MGFLDAGLFQPSTELRHHEYQPLSSHQVPVTKWFFGTYSQLTVTIKPQLCYMFIAQTTVNLAAMQTVLQIEISEA